MLENTSILATSAAYMGLSLNAKTVAVKRECLDVDFQSLHPRAKLPIYGTDDAACIDFFPVLSDTDCPNGYVITKTLLPGEMTAVRLGWAVAMPRNWCLELHSRSGQGKVRISLANRTGIIDADYRGELIALLVNEGSEPYEISEDKAVCQGKPVTAPRMRIREVERLPDTVRGAGGFGSTDS